ncbi:MAG: pectate lyase [Streptomyces sp.]|nr:pectate lyase [Streptomyces sp.]
MRRLSAALLAGACLLLGAPQAQAADADRTPVGWGAGTTGGAGGTTWTVHTRAELKDALAATGPKVIRVVGSINGHEADDGSLLGEQDYAPGYDLAKYMSCFGEDGATWSDTRHDYCKQQRQSRQTGSNKEKAQIQLTVPSDTTLVGVGENARLLGVFLTVNTGTNIIVRNLRLEAPVDHFTSWSPDDGTQGNWNARFDAMTVITGKNIWVDHCTFTDGRFPDREAPVGFHGEHVQRHDGLLDIEDGSDHITVSDSRFEDHDKALLIGSGDSRGDRDRGHLKITFARNLFSDIVQRGPRVRFGQVHVLNNVYVSRNRTPLYALGAGVESAIYSERNVFRYDATLAAYGGTHFHDTGSWVDGRPAGLDKVAAGLGLTDDVGWNPADAYAYQVLKSAAAVERYVLTHAGAGRPHGHA